MTKKIRHNLAQSCPYCTAGPHYSCGHVQAAAPQQEAQEPVAWQGVHDQTDLYYTKPVQADVRPLYTAPQPVREPLTLQQIAKAFAEAGLEPDDYHDYVMIEPLVRAIEAAHGITQKGGD